MRGSVSSQGMPSCRVPLSAIGGGKIVSAFGGRFDAWSFHPTTEEQWLADFRARVLASIGRAYLPVYRLADGEFRALLGRRINWKSRSQIRECIAATAERIGLLHRTSRTSWGEHYQANQLRVLRGELISQIRVIAAHGYLAPLLSDNGTAVAHEYGRPFCRFLQTQQIPFNSKNFIPFHFVCEILTGPGWEGLLRDRRILVVTGLSNKNPAAIKHSLSILGARDTQFLVISPESSRLDKVDTSSLRLPIDVCLVSAGVGAANIIAQLQTLQTVVLDIGGYVHCLEDKTFLAHALFRAPVVS